MAEPDRSPPDQTQQAVAAAWSHVLGVEPIEPTDRFSDLGGTSLLAEALLIELRERLAVPATAALMLDDPTLTEMTRRLEAERDESFARGGRTLTVLRDAGPDPRATVLCFAGAGASAVTFLSLTAALAPDLTVIAFHSPGLTSRGRPSWSVPAIARRHLRGLARLDIHGRQVVVGHSFGGHVATEAVHQLVAAGRPPVSLLLLDTFAAADRGGSVGDGAASEHAPAAAERWRTHLGVATVGVVRYRAARHQALMWEQAIRVQNRYQVHRLPGPVRVFVTDEHRAQEERWAPHLPSDGRVVAVRGDHNAVVSDPVNLAAVVAAIEDDLSGNQQPPGDD